MKKQKTGITFIKGIFIYLLGVSTGTVGAALLAAYVNELHLPFIETSPTRDLPAAQDDDDPTATDEFKFRDLLTRPDDVLTPITATPGNDDLPDPARRFDFYLQLGAYRNNATAETLRGKIALSGLPALIETSQLADGGTLYRVWVGPYPDREQTENIRAQLAFEGYQDISLLQLSRQ